MAEQILVQYDAYDKVNLSCTSGYIQYLVYLLKVSHTLLLLLLSASPFSDLASLTPDALPDATLGLGPA